MTLRNNLHWFICILFALSCARQTSPTGGPKDTIPPTLIKSIPANEAINFHGNSIELQFSEDVTLNAPKEQLIITPTVGKDYKITFRRNIVKIEFEEPLKDSTTYTFNFRETVQDLTEKNPVENLSLAYSTGDYIDSLSIEGKVFDQLQGTPAKDVTVALHQENDTINIFLHPAIYFTKTDDEGNFKISHLKPGNYFLYAFQDKNRNLIVNSRSEAYGFKREHQYLLENIEDAHLGIVKLDAGPLRLTSARPYNTYFNIRSSKYLRTFTLHATDSSDLSYTFGEDQANIRIYDTTEKDSLQVRLVALDSIDNVVDTTLYAKFLTRETTPEQFQMKILSSSLFAHTGQLTAILQFSKPIKELNFDSLYFQVDSLTRVNFSPQDLTWDALPRTMTITKQLDPKYFSTTPTNGQTRRGRLQATAPPSTPQQAETKPLPVNELHLRTAAFMSIENDTSSNTVQKIAPMQQDELAIINIQIQTAEPSFLVQLLDRNYKLVKQVANRSRTRFTDVVPGDYQVRLVLDTNQNGRWDPGNYFTNTEPEPIRYYVAPDGSTILKGVKANWEIGTEGEMLITY